MAIVALIMAGGKSQRFACIEKPMAKLLGESLISRVIKATNASKKILKTYVAVTSSNRETAEEARKRSASVVLTSAKGYHSDMQQAISELNLRGPILILSSDLPLLTGDFLDEIIDLYEKSSMQSLTVLVPIETCRSYGLNPTSFYEYKGGRYVVSGINIVDGNQIMKEQEQEVVISKSPEAVFNINTHKDLELAKSYLISKI